MLKDTLLYLAQNPRLRDFVVQNKITRNASRRFVAGEVLEDAVRATRALNNRGIQVALDLLGENVALKEEATEAARNYINAIELISRTQIDANISIKLTALGLDISPDLCEELLSTILESGQEHNVFVCIDMEGSAYTDQTVAIAKRAHERYGLVGTVIQSYLYRSQADITQLVDQGIRVRLVKGAYKEPQSIAYQEKSDVDNNYVQLMNILLARGNFPAIASHDEAIIDAACKFVRDHGISKSSFEFQMLYGIRRDLQEKLVGQGYNVRVYVPYGSHWYPYLMRRMAERPANLMFVMTNVWR
ncbi:proline dehydrogenase family protein [Dictyobacter kobayashii]|uniref:proline dehydrogenase n=1 Tax=Dictyobacter kobayashii TaxID=2014872 RepID=A0A402AG25_9CHLR|nr:proline dehydrogenase family protein [Dictyobacter kobayashii]GCE18042.1 proline dehydrogenase [Dictyobacter kobayashii]